MTLDGSRVQCVPNVSLAITWREAALPRTFVVMMESIIALPVLMTTVIQRQQTH